MSIPNDIVLFHYPFSPYARKVLWYLTLRGIGFAQCVQPPILPRPDLEALGIRYRRIPLMSIGNDVFCDTRLILEVLEKRFPDGALGSGNAEQKAIEKLLSRMTVETTFARASQLIPTNMPVLKDEKFLKDRTEMTGRTWNKEAMDKARPEVLVHIRDDFMLLENTLLADGREWLLKTSEPSLGDIEAVWPFHWLTTMEGALPPDSISEKQFPKTFAWIKRFDAAVKKACSSAPKPVTVKGDQALGHITAAGTFGGGQVEANDPLGFKEGDIVEVFPTDSGFNHKDKGTLVSLNTEEIAIKASTPKGAKLHIHFPRRMFRVTKAKESSL